MPAVKEMIDVSMSELHVGEASASTSSTGYPAPSSSSGLDPSHAESSGTVSHEDANTPSTSSQVPVDIGLLDAPSLKQKREQALQSICENDTGKGGFDIEHVQLALRALLADKSHIYVPGITMYSEEEALISLDALASQGYTHMAFSFSLEEDLSESISNRMHQVAVWVDIHNKEIHVFNSLGVKLSPASKLRLRHLLGLTAEHNVSDVEPKYKQSDKDKWSCGVHVVWTLAECAGLEAPQVTPQTLDVIQGADILYRHYQIQSANEAKIGEAQAENTRQTRVLLDIIEAKRTEQGFYLATEQAAEGMEPTQASTDTVAEQSSSDTASASAPADMMPGQSSGDTVSVRVFGKMEHGQSTGSTISTQAPVDIFKPLADFLQMIIWGNLDRKKLNDKGEQVGREGQASKADFGKSFHELWFEYKAKHSTDTFGSTVLALVALTGDPQQVMWPALFALSEHVDREEKSRQLKLSVAKEQSKQHRLSETETELMVERITKPYRELLGFQEMLCMEAQAVIQAEALSDLLTQLTHQSANVEAAIIMFINKVYPEDPSEYSLCLRSALPADKATQAKRGKIYIDAATKTYTLLGHDGQVKEGSLGNLVLDDLASILGHADFKKQVLDVIAKDGHTYANFYFESMFKCSRRYMNITLPPLNVSETRELIYLLVSKLAAYALDHAEAILTKDRYLTVERASATAAQLALRQGFEARFTAFGFNESEQIDILGNIIPTRAHVPLLSAIDSGLQSAFVALPSETRMNFMRLLLSFKFPLVDSEVLTGFANLSAEDKIALGLFGFSWLMQLQKKNIIRGGYELCLMSDMPKDNYGNYHYAAMLPDTIYVEKRSAAQLYYIVKAPWGHPVDGILDIRVSGALTLLTLQGLKRQILTETSKREHTYPDELTSQYYDSILALLPSIEPLITIEQVHALTTEQHMALRNEIEIILQASPSAAQAVSSYSLMCYNHMALMFAAITGHDLLLQQYLQNSDAETQVFHPFYLGAAWHLMVQFHHTALADSMVILLLKDRAISTLDITVEMGINVNVIARIAAIPAVEDSIIEKFLHLIGVCDNFDNRLLNFIALVPAFTGLAIQSKIRFMRLLLSLGTPIEDENNLLRGLIELTVEDKFVFDLFCVAYLAKLQEGGVIKVKLHYAYFDSLLSRLPSVDSRITSPQVAVLTERQSSLAQKQYEALYKIITTPTLVDTAGVFIENRSDSYFAFMFAAVTGHPELMQQLLQGDGVPGVHPAHVPHVLTVALCSVAYSGREDSVMIAELLLARGAAIDIPIYDGMRALHFAAAGGSVSMLTWLLDHDADIYSQNQNGDTVLHSAAGQGHVAALTLLLDRGANIDGKGKIESTALHEAAVQGHVACVALLLDRGAFIDAPTSIGLTAFHCAVRKDHKTTVRLLLVHGADINRKMHDGRTALHMAVQAENVSMVALLLKRGADVDAVNISDLPALYYAAMSKKTEVIVKQLVDAGANPNVDTLREILLCIPGDDKDLIDRILYLIAPCPATITLLNTSATGDNEYAMRLGFALLKNPVITVEELVKKGMKTSILWRICSHPSIEPGLFDKTVRALLTLDPTYPIAQHVRERVLGGSSLCEPAVAGPSSSMVSEVSESSVAGPSSSVGSEISEPSASVASILASIGREVSLQATQPTVQQYGLFSASAGPASSNSTSVPGVAESSSVSLLESNSHGVELPTP